MIRRRRYVLFAALLLGLVWFAVMPLFSKDDSAVMPQQLGRLSRSADGVDIPEGSRPRHSSERSAINTRVRSPDTVVGDAGYDDDDLSEIDYPLTELPVKSFRKVSNAVRPAHEEGVWVRVTRHRRRGRVTPSAPPVAASKFTQSLLKRVNVPGHKGRMVRVDPKSLSSRDRRIYDSGWRKYSHNEYVNNMISPQRVLPDVRDPGCHSLEYTVDNLEASVVIVIHNEAWMTLLRTVHSVLDRSPANLLKEIILVDDASTFSHLGSQLTKYVSHISKVRVLRMKYHRGASYARQLGASFVTGNVIVFLDAHCECTEGWLEPLLARVAESESNVAIPVLDIIDDDTFSYLAYSASRIRIGGFDWSLAYKWMQMPDYEKQRRNSSVDPIRNPVMWGGIFAISRDFFNHLNGYDQSLHMSGDGQNIEMSFKIWMCGGTIETIPCSHVGHIFHNRATSGEGKAFSGREVLSNDLALAHMWLDEYKEMHFQKMGIESRPQFNDTTGHMAFRKRLKCRSFDWFLRNVYRDLFAPTLALASGKIRSKMKTGSDVCIALTDLDAEKKLGVSSCQSSDDQNMLMHLDVHQLWALSQIGEIRVDNDCLDFPGDYIRVYSCHGGKGNQEWNYHEDGTIQQVGTKLCLSVSANGKRLTMEKCVASDRQIWYWRRIDGGEESVKTQKPVIKQELAPAD